MKRAVVACACAFVLAFCLACVGCSSGAASSGASSASAASAGSASSETASAEVAASAAQASAASPASQTSLAKGVYVVDVSTDSSMFHLNETADGKGELTVSDEGMSVHMTLVSKKIVNVYQGTAEQAQSDAAGVIQPTNDKVTYSDGYEEEVYGFDIPVPALDEEFDVAILGSKGKWYDHKVAVTNPVSK